jgi:hypothetical protein
MRWVEAAATAESARDLFARLGARPASVAKHVGRTESEVARELLLEALTRAERDQFYDRVAHEMTPAIRQRMIQIAEALERING